MTDPKRIVLLVAAIVVIVGSGLSFFLRSRKPTGKLIVNLNALQGQVLAEQTAEVLENQGRIVLVDVALGGSAASAWQTRRESFLRVIDQHPGLKVVATETIDANELEEGGLEWFLPLAVFHGIVGRSPEVDAIVSFVGLPPLSKGDLQRLGPGTPKLVVLALHGTTPIEPFMASGILQRALVPRRSTVAGSKSLPPTGHKPFDERFQVIMPAGSRAPK